MSVLQYPLTLAAIVLMALPSAVWADVERQATMAESRVLVAARVTDPEGLKNVLQQAVNCIVGPQTADFDSTRVNPCVRFGNGLIPDATSAADKSRYENALSKIKIAMLETDKATRISQLRTIAALLGGDSIPDNNRPAQAPRAPTAEEVAAGVRAADEPAATRPPIPNRAN